MRASVFLLLRFRFIFDRAWHKFMSLPTPTKTKVGNEIQLLTYCTIFSRASQIKFMVNMQFLMFSSFRLVIKFQYICDKFPKILVYRVGKSPCPMVNNSSSTFCKICVTNIFCSHRLDQTNRRHEYGWRGESVGTTKFVAVDQRWSKWFVVNLNVSSIILNLKV